MTTSNGTASISFDYLFPTLTESDPHVKPEEGTTAFVWPTHPRARLAERVDQLCRYARYSYSDLDIERLGLQGRKPEGSRCQGRASSTDRRICGRRGLRFNIGIDIGNGFRRSLPLGGDARTNEKSDDNRQT